MNIDDDFDDDYEDSGFKSLKMKSRLICKKRISITPMRVMSNTRD